jgi:Icc-related predicted phosphoesterase
MKIAAISDTHGEHGKILTYPSADIFIFAGDFLEFGDEEILENFYSWLSYLPYKYKIIVGGNHDWFLEQSPKRSKEFFNAGCIYLEDRSIVINGIKFYGSPWIPRIIGSGVFNKDRGLDIREKWSYIPNDIDILITHAPPYSIFDKPYKSDKSMGCVDLMDIVFKIKPKLHIFGHVHSRGGYKETIDKTIFVNVAFNKPTNKQITIVDLK